MKKFKKLAAGVPVVDGAGAVTPVPIAELAMLVGEALGLSQGISVRNLLKDGKSLEYYDSVETGKRTYPMNVGIVDRINLKAGESLTFAYENATTLKGSFGLLKVAIRFSDGGIKTVDFNPGSVRSTTFTIDSDTEVVDVLIYACDGNGSTAGNKVLFEGLTLVKGKIPMMGWIPAPENMGGVKRRLSIGCEKGGLQCEDEECLGNEKCVESKRCTGSVSTRGGRSAYENTRVAVLRTKGGFFDDYRREYSCGAGYLSAGFGVAKSPVGHISKCASGADVQRGRMHSAVVFDSKNAWNFLSDETTDRRGPRMVCLVPRGDDHALEEIGKEVAVA